MSRLIVKNLPLHVTPARLRKHFEQSGHPPGTITDVKVSQKPDGTSRRFGFVGFKSDQEALAARDWFDRTFIDSTRITVQVSEVSYSLVSEVSKLINVKGREPRMRQPLDRTSAGE